MMDAGELLYLAGTIAAYSWPAGSFLAEIGAYHGRTTAFMAKVLRLLGHEVPLLSIDPFERVGVTPLNPQGSYSQYLGTVSFHNVASRCLPLVAFSNEAAAVVPDKIGVLVIDGCHHYGAICDDLRLYSPKVLSGGLIFVDDYGPAYPDVVRAVDEYFVPENSFVVEHRSYFVVAGHVELGKRSAPKKRPARR
jgi:cephalosporin hydroxylase